MKTRMPRISKEHRSSGIGLLALPVVLLVACGGSPEPPAERADAGAPSEQEIVSRVFDTEWSWGDACESRSPDSTVVNVARLPEDLGDRACWLDLDALRDVDDAAHHALAEALAARFATERNDGTRLAVLPTPRAVIAALDDDATEPSRLLETKPDYALTAYFACPKPQAVSDDPQLPVATSEASGRTAAYATGMPHYANTLETGKMVGQIESLSHLLATLGFRFAREDEGSARLRAIDATFALSSRVWLRHTWREDAPAERQIVFPVCDANGDVQMPWRHWWAQPAPKPSPYALTVTNEIQQRTIGTDGIYTLAVAPLPQRYGSSFPDGGRNVGRGYLYPKERVVVTPADLAAKGFVIVAKKKTAEGQREHVVLSHDLDLMSAPDVEVIEINIAATISEEALAEILGAIAELEENDAAPREPGER